MKTKVYAVARWDDYYPLPDNVVKVFSSMEAAEKFVREKGWIYSTNCDIFDYEAEES